MAELPRRATLRVLVGILISSALLLGPLSSPASASGPTTECQLTAQSTPTTVGQNATFRFFAAARMPEDVPPSPSGLVTYFDGPPILGDIIGHLGAVPDLHLGQQRHLLHQSSLSVGDHTIYAVLVSPDRRHARASPEGDPPGQPAAGAAEHHRRRVVGQPVEVRAERDLHGRREPARAAARCRARCSSRPTATTSALRSPSTAAATRRSARRPSRSATTRSPRTFTSNNANTLNSSGDLRGGQTVQKADTTDRP